MSNPTRCDVWACEVCGVYWLQRELAERCCAPDFCECGQQKEPGRTVCASCLTRIQRERLLALPRADDHDGPVVAEDGDHYWSSPAEWVDEQRCDLPEYRVEFVHPCDVQTSADVDAVRIAEDVIEWLEGDFDESACGQFDGESLTQVLRQWLDAQGAEWWVPDMTRVLVLAEWMDAEGGDDA